MKLPPFAPLRLHTAFALLGVAFLGIFSWVFAQEYFAEWRTLQAEFARLQQQVKDPHQLSLAPPVEGIRQIWLPDVDRVDRCTTCHLGIDDPVFREARQPFRSHSGTWLATHPPDTFGCTPCHGGQGEATTYRDAAHQPIAFWHEPMRPRDELQASCGVCHREREPRDAPTLGAGRALIAESGCAACHDIPGFAADEVQAPRLENVGYKLRADWLRAWLMEPAAVLPEARMPNFRLSAKEVDSLVAFLRTQRAMPPLEWSSVDWSRTDAARGRALFDRAQCDTCHRVRGSGGTLGPDLSGIGTKVRREWLFGFIKDPMREQPQTRMLRYRLDDEEIRDIVAFLMQEMRGAGAAAAEPDTPLPGPRQIEEGRQAFVRLGCYGCHRFDGSGALGKIGPNLAGVGNRFVEPGELAGHGVEPTLANWLQLKLRDPRKLSAESRMPTYAFTPGQARAVAVALLSIRKADLPASRVTNEALKEPYEPQGEFGALVSRYRCLTCHQLRGWGGTLANVPLDRVGSQYRRDYLAAYFERPHAVRPSIDERMPHFGMTREEAETLADYFARVFVDDAMEQPFAADAAAARRGEQLIGRLECRTCHKVAGQGGEIGPDLTVATRRLKPGWIQAWVSSPQKWRPGTLQPEFGLKPDEARDIAAYLLKPNGRAAGVAAAAAAGSSP